MPYSAEQLKSIALKLKERHITDVAVAEELINDTGSGKVFYCAYQEPSPRAPYTPATALIQAIGTRHIKISPIVATQSRPDMSAGMYRMVYSQAAEPLTIAAASTSPVDLNTVNLQSFDATPNRHPRLARPVRRPHQSHPPQPPAPLHPLHHRGPQRHRHRPPHLHARRLRPDLQTAPGRCR
jgi:hypothetical protein